MDNAPARLAHPTMSDIGERGERFTFRFTPPTSGSLRESWNEADALLYTAMTEIIHYRLRMVLTPRLEPEWSYAHMDWISRIMQVPERVPPHSLTVEWNDPDLTWCLNGASGSARMLSPDQENLALSLERNPGELPDVIMIAWGLTDPQSRLLTSLAPVLLEDTPGATSIQEVVGHTATRIKKLPHELLLAAATLAETLPEPQLDPLIELTRASLAPSRA